MDDQEPDDQEPDDQESRTVVFRSADGVGVIELNRPYVRNALDRTAQREFDAALRAAEADESLRCLVLTGAGGRALSAGWDLKELATLPPESESALLREREAWLWRWFSTPLPTVAAMRGAAYGLGAYLAACSDLRVGGPGTRFRITGTSYGYASLTWLLPDIIGHAHATDVLFTGRVLDGTEAHRLGLFSRYVADDEILATSVALAEQVAALPGTGVRDAKRLMREHRTCALRERYDAENRLLAADPRPARDLF
ncbi:enoyl-CoA hydratase/isomerase family protein [Gordonia polyisoprenivorans]|uniref:enoyl-CoA hydratase/isomerase family protein n=1 Tax=Gordonia polyisoprenivorans TaxID=84595 RepID=UPI00036050BB|nr:enoyl-CoA hydratase/isomerase family protein [Gordonia polyisoprenivorans]